MRWPWQRRAEPSVEKRASGTYTAQILAARDAYITGQSGTAELTATVQACVSLWEAGLSMADVNGTDLLSRRNLALMARSLALRGEALFVIEDDGLVIAHEWDVSTRGGRPRAYRCALPDTGGGEHRNVLAGEVLHIVIGSSATMPWVGTSPLRRASLTAAMLSAVEEALGEVFAEAPLGSQIVPMPETAEHDLQTLGRDFRGRRGRVLMRESVQVSAAGGPAPQVDWRPTTTSPDLSKAEALTTLAAARDSIAMAFGVLPGMLNPMTTGPLIREGQRHLAQWMLQPIAALVGEEATEKLGVPVSLDVMRPLQAFDAGGRARAAATMVEALARAKEAGIDAAPAMKFIDWEKA
ncbi:MAG: phage portal protein [Pseudomonadota bacterium]